jgi:hypothetical protein
MDRAVDAQAMSAGVWHGRAVEPVAWSLAA